MNKINKFTNFESDPTIDMTITSFIHEMFVQARYYAAILNNTVNYNQYKVYWLSQ